MQLFGASDRLYVVERGELDDRARLAFTNGQCHGMAMALHEKTGWSMVAIDHLDAGCQHVCVRREDGRLIDIRGAHEADALASSDAGMTTRDIGIAEIAELVTQHGWATADVAGASPWLNSLRALADRDHAHPMPESFRRCVDVDDGFQIQLEWAGDTHMEAFVRRSPSGSWTGYGEIPLRRDPGTQRYVIDFTEAEFLRVLRLLTEQFDRDRAERKIAAS